LSTVEILIPIYEEEKSIEKFIDEVIKLSINDRLGICITFVMDPGSDKSEELLQKITLQLKNIISIKTVIMNERIGQANSIFVGLTLSKADAVIVIDVDLQDPINLIPFLISKWKEGFDIVLPRRIENKFNFYLIPSQIFYLLINIFSFYQIPKNIGDFRLLDKKVVKSIVERNPPRPFLRGDTKFRRYKTFIFDFKRKTRENGETRYTNNLMRFKVAFNALINYSFFFQFLFSINSLYFIVNIIKQTNLFSNLFVVLSTLSSFVIAFICVILIITNHYQIKNNKNTFLIDKIIR
jgi:glycosyltransferase involved in cell wall biosynthesis